VVKVATPGSHSNFYSSSQIMTSAEVGSVAPVPEVIDLTELSSDSEEDEDDHSGTEDASEVVSDGEEVELIIDQHARAQLQRAILNASESRLRDLLSGLVNTMPAAERAVMAELLTVHRGTREIMPRWETCAVCSEEFDVNAQLEDGECEFHPGMVALFP
jgi:hypothetical protein